MSASRQRPKPARSPRSPSWAAVHGPNGSAVLFFPGNGDLDLLLRRVTDRLPALRPPWKWTLEIRDGDWQRSVTRVLDRSRAVPAWDLGAVIAEAGLADGTWVGSSRSLPNARGSGQAR